MRFILVLLCLLLVARACGLTRAEVQKQLDETGYCSVPPGVHELDGPIVVRAGQTLQGCGYASVLKLTRGATALELGEAPGSERPYLYGAAACWLRIEGGTLRVNKIGQHNELIGVWVSGAAGDGFLLQGIGEQMRLQDCKAWGNGGAGFAIRSDAGNNGVLLEHCNAQNNLGPGVLIETRHVDAASTHHVLRHCTIQGNGRDNELDLSRDGRIDATDLSLALSSATQSRAAAIAVRMGSETTRADVLLSGWVNVLQMDSCWIEATAAPVALLAEPRQFGTVTRYVGGLWIGGASNVYRAGGGTAVLLRRPYLATIDALTISPQAARLVVETADTRNLGGARRGILPTQIALDLPIAQR